MTEQTAQEAARTAIEQVAGSHAAWIAAAIPVATAFLHRLTSGDRLLRLGAYSAHFTTDDLWRELTLGSRPALPAPKEPRAMGALMVQLRKLKLCEHTGTWSKSTRAACHARPLAIWRAL